MEKKTGLEIWSEKVGYYGGSFFVFVVLFAGFGLIPWVYTLYYTVIIIALFLAVYAFGWRRHYEQKQNESLIRLLMNNGIVEEAKEDG